MAHSLRRRAALRRIRALGPFARVLVVCTGNLCRSPYAERALLAQVRDEGKERSAISVRSAGLLGSGRSPPRTAILAARRKGVELDDHRSTPLSGKLARAAQLVLVMEERHARTVERLYGASPRRIVLLGDLDPEPSSLREVDDPLNGPPEVFDACYARIDRCLEALLQAGRRRPPSPRRVHS